VRPFYNTILTTYFVIPFSFFHVIPLAADPYISGENVDNPESYIVKFKQSYQKLCIKGARKHAGGSASIFPHFLTHSAEKNGIKNL
jgi:hypothetical protein